MGAVDAVFLVCLDHEGTAYPNFSRMKTSLGFDRESSAPEAGAKIWNSNEFSERIVAPLEDFYSSHDLTILTEETVGGDQGQVLWDLYAIGDVPSDIRELVTGRLVELKVNQDAVGFAINTPQNVLFTIDLTTPNAFFE